MKIWQNYDITGWLTGIVAVTACYTVATRSLQLHHSHNCEQRLRPIVVLLTFSRWTLVTCLGKLRVASRPHSSKCHSIKGCTFVRMGHCITTNVVSYWEWTHSLWGWKVWGKWGDAAFHQNSLTTFSRSSEKELLMINSMVQYNKNSSAQSQILKHCA